MLLNFIILQSKNNLEYKTFWVDIDFSKIFMLDNIDQN
jgi:hypothetical protein